MKFIRVILRPDLNLATYSGPRFDEGGNSVGPDYNDGPVFRDNSGCSPSLDEDAREVIVACKQCGAEISWIFECADPANRTPLLFGDAPPECEMDPYCDVCQPFFIHNGERYDIAAARIQ